MCGVEGEEQEARVTFQCVLEPYRTEMRYAMCGREEEEGDKKFLICVTFFLDAPLGCRKFARVL